jgi:hypothetical protein
LAAWLLSASLVLASLPSEARPRARFAAISKRPCTGGITINKSITVIKPVPVTKTVDDLKPVVITKNINIVTQVDASNTISIEKTDISKDIEINKPVVEARGNASSRSRSARKSA